MRQQPVELNPVEWLSGLSGASFDYLRFPGNYGDALIWHGTQEAFSRAGIASRTIGCADEPEGDVLVVDGGGNLVDLYRDVSEFLNSHGRKYRSVVILPHTVTGAGPLASISRLGDRVTIFCRELVSWECVRMSAPNARCFLWHDCAFYLRLPSPGLKPPAGSVLHVLRKDVEGSGAPHPPGNRDISLEGYAMSPLQPMLDILGGYALVVTDRLHVAIAACLIGAEVELRPNSYFKNRAVYDYSLAGRPNVTFRASPWR